MSVTAAVTALKRRYPRMCRDGLTPMYQTDSSESLEAILEDAHRFPDQIKTCREWLRTCNVIKTTRTTHDTYMYKHEVEYEVGRWISHLSFLVAVQLEGVPMVQSTDRPYAGWLPLGAVRPGAV